MNPHKGSILNMRETTFMTRPNRFALVTGLGTLCLGLLVVLSSRGQGTVPAGDLAKLIDVELKNIDAELGKAKLLKKGQKRVRMAAFMIAAYAQDAKDNGPAMATLRDQAFKVMKAAEAGDAPEVKKLRAGLAANIKPDPAANTAPVALEKHLDLETVMRMFSNAQVGGFSLEKALEDLIEMKTFDAAQLEKTALLSEKVAMMAKLAQGYAPAVDKGSKTKKAWIELATEMQLAAGELAAAAHAKKDADIGKLANKLTGTCTKCHDIFR
jgi:hypothetical protein